MKIIKNYYKNKIIKNNNRIIFIKDINYYELYIFFDFFCQLFRNFYPDYTNKLTYFYYLKLFRTF